MTRWLWVFIVFATIAGPAAARLLHGSAGSVTPPTTNATPMMLAD